MSSLLLRRLASPPRLALFSISRSITTTAGPIELDYSAVIPESGNETERPLVIMHGIFGSKRNWSSLCKSFSRDLNRPVYALDLRNHGESPHALPMTYSAMANDVLHFFEHKRLTDVTLLGHSMGGKVAMSVALSQSHPVSTLIIEDISPARGRLSGEFSKHIEGMRKIESMKLKTRKDASAVLHEFEQDPNVVMFLLTNLVVPPSSSPEHVHFRVPLDILAESVENIGSFPYEAGERTWEGKTMFIKGEKSAFLNRHNIPLAGQFFPNMVLKQLPTQHWVHAEQPNEFKDLVSEFIQ